jgi:hypothetical protein
MRNPDWRKNWFRHYFECHVQGWGGDSQLGMYDTLAEAMTEASEHVRDYKGTVFVWSERHISLPLGWKLSRSVMVARVSE